MMRVLFIALAVGWLGGCEVAPESPGHDYVKSVQKLKQMADQHLRQGRLPQAETVLRQLVSLPLPSDEPRAALLAQDGYFSLCSVMLATGRGNMAIDEAAQGLKLTDKPTVFKANLHAVRAMALEATNRAADALTDYEAAMGIHKQLFDEALTRHKGDG